MRENAIIAGVAIGGTLLFYYAGRIVAKANCLDILTKKKKRYSFI